MGMILRLLSLESRLMDRTFFLSTELKIRTLGETACSNPRAVLDLSARAPSADLKEVLQKGKGMTDKEWNAGRLVSVSGAYWEAFALHAGLSLDVFTMLGDEPMETAALAQKVNADERGLEILLNASDGYGASLQGRWKIHEYGTKQHLSEDHLAFLRSDIIKHHHHLAFSWSRLSEAVRKGLPVRKKKRTKDELRSFLLAMMNQAAALRPVWPMRSIFTTDDTCSIWEGAGHVCPSLLPGQHGHEGHHIRFACSEALCPSGH
jgi:hypothetical protein